MPEHPGVYVEEVPGAFRAVAGVSPNIPVLAGLVNRQNIPLHQSVRGIPIWHSEPSYLNVRHLVMFIEQSLSQGLQWAVFQPNNSRLWSRVSNSIGNFLTSQWQSGALQGTMPQQAYFVRCDNTTMTQNDLDNGRLVAMVGIAPVYPAEFVVIRIAIQTKKK
jgi:uncharacterized protein